LKGRGWQSCPFVLHKREDVCPIAEESRHCTYHLEAALYDGYGDLIRVSERVGGVGGDHVGRLSPFHLSSTSLAAAEVVTGRSVFLGHWMNHYGHFITETASRFWSLLSHNDYDNYIFFPFIFGPIDTGRHDFQAEICSSLQIAPSKIRIIREPCRFEQIDVPEQAWPINSPAKAIIREVYDRVVPIRSRHADGSRVFLSRRPALARLANAPEVEEVFSELGFRVIYPEDLSFRDQMRIFSSASVISGFAGSAMHNCVFCAPGTALIEVGDKRAPHGFTPMQMVANALGEVKASRIPLHDRLNGRADLGALREQVRTTIEIAS
jgi:hypothetical protein